MAVFKGTGQLTGRDQSRCMRHIAHEPSLLSIRNLSQVFVVPVSGIRRGTADDQAGLERLGLLLERGVVDEVGGGIKGVGKRLEVDGRGGDLLLGGVVTVGQMSSVGQTETHQTILGLDQCRKGSETDAMSDTSRVSEFDLTSPSKGGLEDMPGD